MSFLKRVVERHFEKVSDDPSDPFYKCLVSSDCTRPLNGRKQSNLLEHLKKHRSFYKEHYGAEERSKNGTVERLEFIQHCVELVTVNSEPFALLGKSGFLKMNRDKLQRLEDQGQCTDLYAPEFPAVKKHLHYLAEEIIKEIKLEVRDKFVSLMIDGASKHGRSILGVYIQFSHEFKINTRLIGMIPMSVSHTGANLAAVVHDCLKKVGVSLSRVVAINTDNASNMLSMIKHLNDICNRPSEGEDKTTSETDFEHQPFIPSAEKDYDVLLSDFIAQKEMEELCSNSSSEDEKDQTSLDSLLEEIENIIGPQTSQIQSVRCAAHTFHLSVTDTLDIDDFKVIILICREVTKQLRKNSNIIELQDKGIPFKMPRNDVETRWNSIYAMVCRVLFEMITFPCTLLLIFPIFIRREAARSDMQLQTSD